METLIVIAALCFIAFMVTDLLKSASVDITISLNKQPAQPVYYPAARPARKHFEPVSNPYKLPASKPRIDTTRNDFRDLSHPRPAAKAALKALPAAKLSERIKAAHPDHGGSREQLEKVLKERR